IWRQRAPADSECAAAVGAKNSTGTLRMPSLSTGRLASGLGKTQAILRVFPMDVQKTMEFILRQQAKAEGEMAAMRQRQAESEAKAERQMAAIRKLIQTGMRMIVKNDEQIKGLAAAHKELAAAQKVTEAELRGLIVALRRGGNGSHRKN